MNGHLLKLAFGATAAAWIVAGCDEDHGNWGNPTAVCEAPDGACWDWHCTVSGCEPRFTDDIEDAWLPECAEGEQLHASWSGGRFVEIHVFCVEASAGGAFFWAANPYQGRPLLCDSDADCPQIEPNDQLTECVSGLCQSTDTELYPRDLVSRETAEALCFASFSRAETVDDVELVQSVYDDIEAACPDGWDEPCAGPLPDYCWSLEE